MSLNATAQTFKALHVPGKPIVLANVYDLLSAEAVASLPSSKALATASYAVARAAGFDDDHLSLETNLAAVKLVARAAKANGKPLSVDIQDAYGDRLEEAIGALIDEGVVGVNLEDVDLATQKQHPIDVAADRVRRAIAAAEKKGVPDFVVNARCDSLIKGGNIEDAVARGKAYLAAGATTVFVWGGSARGGTTKEEVVTLIKEFGGRLNVSLKNVPGGLTIPELAQLGVARISMGPALQFAAMKAYGDAADGLLKQAA